VGFELDGKRRKRLREEIINSFVGRGEFSLFVSDNLSLEFNVMVGGDSFEIQLHQFIVKIEKRGQLDRLCLALMDERPLKADLLAIAREILQTMEPASGPPFRRSLTTWPPRTRRPFVWTTKLSKQRR
jgi:Effector-associated domain 1